MDALTNNSFSWATDVHMDHVNDPSCFNGFIDAVKRQNPKVFVLTGDIELAGGVLETVKKIQAAINCPVYFILGNHDFCGGSVDKLRSQASELSLEKDNCLYLHGKGVVKLNDSTALIGTDGWIDGTGDLVNSHTSAVDFDQIEDVRADWDEVHSEKMREKLVAMAKPSVDYVREVLPQALKSYKKVILATHIPPFKEAAVDDGGTPMGDTFTPFNVCQTLGDEIASIMKNYPKNELLVLCGHTHNYSDCKPLKNVRVIVGEAKYTKPTPQERVDLDAKSFMGVVKPKKKSMFSFVTKPFK